MLNLTRDAASNVELGTHGDTCLTDLTFMSCKAGIDSSTGGSHLGTQYVGKLIEQVEVLLRTYTVATGDDDGRILDVHLRFFNVAVDDGNYEVLLTYKVGHLMFHHFSLVMGIEDLLLHHPLTYCSHLWPVVGVDDPGYDVATKGGTDLIEQVFVDLTCLLLFMVANLERSTVGCESTAQC